MNFRILASLLVIGVMSAGVGYGTFAFFSDTETSTGNTFLAGDLDLTLNGQNGVTGTITSNNFAPGDSTSGSLLLRNEGSIFTGDAQGHTVDLDLKVNVTVIDDQGNPADPEDGGVSTVGLDKFLILTTFSYDGTSLLGQIGDLDADGRANTLADAKLAGVFKDLADPGATGKSLAVTVQFSPAAGNDLKRDQVSVDFTFYLSQAADADLS
ncbi:MAG TPA: TasA family protein [Candidatus Thermoplasmatota archaeon]|nr:TasA family protein [Candidatus Thermoplasmatota archaeon]